MFDQVKNLKGLTALLGQAPELRRKMEQLQEGLARKTVQADAGAGAVRVTVNGKLQVMKVELDETMVRAMVGDGPQQDKELIEELIAAATNEAMRRAQQLVQEEMTRMAGGLNLPGISQMLGQ